MRQRPTITLCTVALFTTLCCNSTFATSGTQIPPEVTEANNQALDAGIDAQDAINEAIGLYEGVSSSIDYLASKISDAEELGFYYSLTVVPALHNQNDMLANQYIGFWTYNAMGEPIAPPLTTAIGKYDAASKLLNDGYDYISEEKWTLATSKFNTAKSLFEGSTSRAQQYIPVVNAFDASTVNDAHTAFDTAYGIWLAEQYDDGYGNV
ncbi:hypothetical protein [Crateriforma conspicua]|uniref:Uncharacterized protein n=1 Tax=Crateriforma conspicua TaxID=2527996 RepID=A0A5C6FFS4_9PLAN|nr:hypothetical protein [Crateriforma conspicua]TWU59612.1 hypothetical protein V7x_55220 [Crateriforma conspicua]